MPHNVVRTSCKAHSILFTMNTLFSVSFLKLHHTGAKEAWNRILGTLTRVEKRDGNKLMVIRELNAFTSNDLFPFLSFIPRNVF